MKKMFDIVIAQLSKRVPTCFFFRFRLLQPSKDFWLPEAASSLATKGAEEFPFLQLYTHRAHSPLPEFLGLASLVPATDRD